MPKTLSPMMQHYMEIKTQHPDCLVFYRLGDFYEMFFEDAITASKILGLTLTGRDCGLDERAPMCGVPYHSVDSYINKLILSGHKVAICEQMEDPALAKGLVQRSVTRVITPGTLIEDKLLDESDNNYIMSLCIRNNGLSAACCDVSTGEFFVFTINHANALEQFFDEFHRLAPSELIVEEDLLSNTGLKNRLSSCCYLERMPKAYFGYNSCCERLLNHFKVATLDGYGIGDDELAICSAGALLRYLHDTQKNALGHINTIKVLNRSRFMQLDSVTRRNLELTTHQRSGAANKYTLLHLLNRTKTAMGARMLRSWVECPLQAVEDIEYRQRAVTALFSNLMLRRSVFEHLDSMYDIGRLCSRIAYNTVNAKDCINLANTLIHIEPIRMLIGGMQADSLNDLTHELDSMEDISSLITTILSDNPPTNMKDGGYIANGYNAEIDELRSISKQSSELLEQIAVREREQSGIKTLRVGFNRVLGYYIEVPKSATSKVPQYYERRQTLANNERYISPELKQLEDKLLSADERLAQLEQEIFNSIKVQLMACCDRLQRNASALAVLDCYCSLADVAVQNHYTCPAITDDGCISIRDGRHPIVENSMKDDFIPNDVELDGHDNRLLIITGPNMAGKSTYMRQIALITLMAHIGSYVPASEASICIVDRIFTRIGANDDLATGKSTFMVEMSETANILNNATGRSLLILDEIGRGTSTFDGLSIAWAVLEYIANTDLCGAKTLFATHYHELSELEGKLEGVKNYLITAKEFKDEIIFLRKIVRGSADKSFGVQAARMAGLPDSVITRSKQILRELEHSDILNKSSGLVESNDYDKRSSVSSTAQAVLQDIANLNLDKMTPLAALSKLYDYCEALKG